MKKKLLIVFGIIVGLIIIFFMFFSFFNFNDSNTQTLFSNHMLLSDNFPDKFKPYIDELKKAYPNWEFKALYTNLNWKYVIDKENVFGKNLVPKSYSDNWKNTKPGEYNVEVDSGWVDSSRRAVEFAIDPRNFLNNVRVFQFEELSYNSTTNTKTSIEKILYGTEFYNRIVEYKNANGTNIVTDKKYSDFILSAAKTSKVSAFHLASRIKQEVGPYLSHGSISGTIKGYEGLYNFYNIGATSSSEPMGAIKNGLRYAKDGKGASTAIKTKYLIPWNSKDRAITGGAIFIGSSYINLGQNTVYLQKFHVSDITGEELFWHQYMTNVLAPYSESKLIYNGYANSNLLNSSMSFIIPIYDNMPELPCKSPAILDNDFTSDNTEVFADVDTSLNIRTGPGSSYEVLTKVQGGQVMTRLEKGRQKGELWDRVKLKNGLVGYAFQTYLKKVPEQQVEKIELFLDKNTINKGERIQLKAKISPNDVKDKTLKYSSTDTKVASVDSEGFILGVGSGEATIIAKSNNGITANIKIKVYSPVTDIIIGAKNIMLQEDENFKLDVMVLPEDANNKELLFISENPNIVNVDKQGILTGISQGETKIIVKAEGEISKEIHVKVIKKLIEGEIVFDDSLVVNGNEISGLESKNNTVDNLIQKIKTNYKIEVYNFNGERIKANSLVGTGCAVKLLDESNNVIIQYEVIMYGDVNGDGKINSIDLLVLQRHILEIKKLNGIFIKAGNVRKNGKNPNSVDCLLIQRHILGIQLAN